MTRNVSQWLTCLGACLVLTACGGGDTGNTPAGAGTGTGGTGSSALVSGAITGFGSVIVEGVKYEDAAARVSVEDDSAAPRSASVSDLKLGMQVEVKTDSAGNATSVTVSSEVFGTITSLTADGFVVAGQTVKISSDPANPTVFEGTGALSGLAVNDRVEVHGKRDAAGAIVASRVERKDPSAVTAVRVLGTVSGHNATDKSFTLAGLLVKYDAATRLLPTGATLSDGQRVAVWSNAPLSGNTLTARSIVVKRHNLSDSDRARIGGFIRNLDFAARTFSIDGIDVDASGATYQKGTAADLANGRKVRVWGTFAAGKLTASEVRFVRDQGDATVELTGVVTDYAGGAFKVRGVPIDASGAGIEFRNGSKANLANGVLVKLQGTVSGTVVLPTEIEFVTSGDGRQRWLLGEVSAYDATAGTFRLMNLGLKLTDATTFRNADGSGAARSEFGNTDRVQVRGAFQAGVFVVSEVVFRPGIGIVVDSVEGAAYDVDVSGGVFKLNGTVVRLGSTTTVEGSLANLRNGTRVEVYGTVVAGQLVASRLQIRTADPVELVRVRGMIGDFVSASDFRVAGQKLDASAATFEPAGRSSADLANGRFVEARGSVVDGVLKASKVEFK